jgi:hypothetical protein
MFSAPSTQEQLMLKQIAAIAALGVLAIAARPAARPVMSPPTPADGHTIHVLAPHVINGHVQGPYHHYCKVISPEPVIECLICATAESLARLTQSEYILAKTITRTPLISLAEWNKNWHDHQQEIATGRVQVLDMPADQAKGVADLVATTDGIIYHLWPESAKVPSGRVVIGQSVGHVNITAAEKTMRRP